MRVTWIMTRTRLWWTTVATNRTSGATQAEHRWCRAYPARLRLTGPPLFQGTPLTVWGVWSVKLRHFTRTMWGQGAIASSTPRCSRWASSTTSWTSLTSITSSRTPRTTSSSESDNSGWVLVLRKVEPQLTPLMAEPLLPPYCQALGGQPTTWETWSTTFRVLDKKEFRFKIISMCSSSSFDICRCPIKYLWKVRAETISYGGFEAMIFLLSALSPPKHLCAPQKTGCRGEQTNLSFCATYLRLHGL